MVLKPQWSFLKTQTWRMKQFQSVEQNSGICSYILRTLLKCNMEPENGPLERGNSFWKPMDFWETPFVTFPGYMF